MCSNFDRCNCAITRPIVDYLAVDLTSWSAAALLFELVTQFDWWVCSFRSLSTHSLPVNSARSVRRPISQRLTDSIARPFIGRLWTTKRKTLFIGRSDVWPNNAEQFGAQKALSSQPQTVWPLVSWFLISVWFRSDFSLISRAIMKIAFIRNFLCNFSLCHLRNALGPANRRATVEYAL